ncbi:alpha-L-fucosidase [Paenibacillus cymbidii]|uniref:alpha-L-fucosidase n=1 Tax=Paenibacillus cymbidii TaxID=1639034 RepID=UPI001081F1AE|nr:alpha-L-fucosidase [Paenibacillus cymbidii]
MTTDLLPTPSSQQRRWQDFELGMFCHFGMNTFTGNEWGDGTDSPELFNPTAFDARQWVRVARRAGFNYLILTAKHHDGFCLWPTRTTDYSVASSPWKDGKGDVVREVADACREAGLPFGLYLSPWDRHEPCYPDKAAYDDFYAAQLTELLTGYGPLVEVWFDGAGSEGREYDWRRIIALVERYQPDAMRFNMGVPTIRWVGNEDGVAPYPCWNAATEAKASMFTKDMLTWLPETPKWVPAECDVPIREKAWFWHPDGHRKLWSDERLIDMYYRSVGHGCNLLMNLAPDNRGLIPDVDANAAYRLFDEMRRRFVSPLAQIDGAGSEIRLRLPERQAVDHVILAERIEGGERVRDYVLEARREDGSWRELVRGSAIGHKKIDRFEAVDTDVLRVRVQRAEAEPLFRSFAAYRAGAIR